MKTIKTTTRILAASLMAAALTATSAFAGTSIEEAQMLVKLKTKYPATQFKAVNTTKFPGIFEVVMGRNVAYVEETGRYFLFGHVFDMQTQTDLTEAAYPTQAGGPVEGGAAPRAEASRIDFGSLPLKDAIVTIKGNGSRKLAVFSDPDCPYCRQLEGNLASITDVTIYTFLMPLEQLHPEAKAKSIGVWCASDKAKAWSDLMQRNVVPTGTCDNPVERNVALAEKFGINGTPTLILADGSIQRGALSVTRLEAVLGSVKVASK